MGTRERLRGFNAGPSLWGHQPVSGEALRNDKAGLLSGRCRVWTEVGGGREVRRLVQLCGEKALVGEKRK